ncbi:phage tail tape measure protein [Parasedimentitalea marina]|uniref:Phage tail tape measure protein n=1 Tax=Parasedimentitalea marina TaxID=2483033 RepID=A0A3T0N1I7_9RHOB|nr:phage tail tape measure protein [Parasedimentitalea marina]AZV77876.1 phage tail tape measure protein [Parasedimentitalea marina]
MAVGDLNVALILDLVDRASGPARQVMGALQQIGHVTEQTGRNGVDWANAQIAATEARRAALRGEAFAVAATGYALYKALQPAIQFETAMAGVSKVIDFDSPEGLDKMSSDILALTTSGALPMAAEGIAEIIEAAGQAGIVDSALPDDEERNQLLAFARDAAQMGVAFDITAEQSGQAMATWRSAMKLTASDALGLGDAINHISNNMNATAPAMVDIIRRQGAVAQSAGLVEQEIAALAGAFLSGGAAPEVAATGMKNFLGALTKGEAVTKRQAKVLDALGFDPVALSKRMHEDAQGAILDVVNAMADLPEYQQSAAISQLFGEESKGAIAPLLTNVDLLREAFELIADPSDYAGSMLAEYQKQAATTANAIVVTTNFVKGFAIAAGSILLPELNELLAVLQPMIGASIEWAEAHPELITQLFRLTAGLLAVKIASIGLRWGLFSTLLPILHVFRAASWMVMMLPRLAAGLLALLNPLKLIRGALFALRLAFIATGVGALLVGIAMAGVWIYNNWQGLQTFFVGFWQTFRDALGPAAPMLDSIITYAKEIWQWFTNLLGPMDATEQQWLSWGTNAGTALGGVVGRVIEWTSANSGLVATVAKLYGGWLALRLVWLLPMAPIRAAGRLLAWIGKGPMVALLRGVKLLSTAFWRLGLLMLANPVGLIITSLAALALVVYQNWDRLVAFLTEKVEAVRAAFDQGILQGVFKLLAEFNPFTLAMEGMQGLIAYVMELLGVPEQIVEAFRAFSLYDTGVALIQSLWDGLGSLVGAMVDEIRLNMEDGILNGVFKLIAKFNPFTAAVDGAARMVAVAMELMGVPDEIIAKFAEFSLYDTGVALLQSLWDGMSSLLTEMVDAITAKLAALKPQWITDVMNWVSGDDPNSSQPAGRDSGGPVRAGIPYLVGERSPEIFVPGVSGSILPTRVLRAAMAASAITAPAAALPSQAEVLQSIDQRPAMSAPAAAPAIVQEGDTVTFNIYPTPGMSPEDVAREVRRELDAREDARRSDLHDGATF